MVTGNVLPSFRRARYSPVCSVPSLSFNHGAEIHRDPFQVIGSNHLPDGKPMREIILSIPESFECSVVRVRQVTLCVRFIDNLGQEVCKLAESILALPQRPLCLFPFGKVPDRLDRTDDLIFAGCKAGLLCP